MILDVIVYGIKIKMKKGQSLDEILESYVKLSKQEKEYIRKELGGASVERKL